MSDFPAQNTVKFKICYYLITYKCRIIAFLQCKNILLDSEFIGGGFDCLCKIIAVKCGTKARLRNRKWHGAHGM